MFCSLGKGLVLSSNKRRIHKAAKPGLRRAKEERVGQGAAYNSAAAAAT